MNRIDKDEVLRYLGYRGQAIAPGLDSLIDEGIARCQAVARPGAVHRIFALERRDGVHALAGTGVLLEGESMEKHLRGATHAAVMAATLGAAIETEIRVAQQVDMTRSLVLDAAATQWVEQYCDRVEAEIRAEAAEQGLHGNFRFSPGYGDLSLSLQPEILGILNAGRRIGLTCTDSLILLPRKSVTAIIGLFPKVPAQTERPGCAACSLRGSCDFRSCKKV